MFEVLGFYKFIKIKSLKKNKILLQDFLIKKEIRGTIIIANEGINGTISGKSKNIEWLTCFTSILDSWSILSHQARLIRKIASSGIWKL